MRSAFIVGAKLLGLVVITWTFGLIASLIQTTGWWMGAYEEETASALLSFSLIGMCVQLVLYIVLASVLILRTEWLARVVGLEEGPVPAGFRAPEALLQAGIALIGIYLIGVFLPGLVVALWGLVKGVETFMYVRRASALSFPDLTTVVKAGLSVVIGAICLFRAKQLAGVISRRSGNADENIAAG